MVGWKENELSLLESLGITRLYHVTDKDNLASIVKERGLSSWSKLQDNQIKVPRPGSDSITRRLDLRSGRENSVHLYVSYPSEGILNHMKGTKRFNDLFVLEIPLNAIRPADIRFWIGDPYLDGVAFDDVHDFCEAVNKDPRCLPSVTVDIKSSIHINYICNIPEDVRTRISEAHPTAIIFVVDQSCSMARGTELDNVEYDYISELVAISINNQIENFIEKCRDEEGEINHLYDIAVIGYGNTVRVAWTGDLQKKSFHSPEELLAQTKSPSERYRWVVPRDSDTSGRCDLAFAEVHKLLSEWISREENRFSYPPTVIHISDGDVKREYQRDFLLNAERIKSLQTAIGGVVVWNICYFPKKYNEFVFISGEELPALSSFPGGLVMYEASSYLPLEQFGDKAQIFHKGGLPCKAMVVHAKMNTLFDALRLCVLPNSNIK